MKKVSLLSTFLAIVTLLSAQDTIKFKSGRSIEGTIINLSGGKINIVVEGDTLKYYPDQISTIMFCEKVKTKKDNYCNCDSSTIGFRTSGEIDTPATYKEAFQKQKEAMEKQKEAAAKQQLLAKEQSEKAKEQQEMMLAVKQEMLKDGLIQKDENYELIINNREMFIDGKKLAESVHHKYIELINSKRNKAFGEKEEWRIK